MKKNADPVNAVLRWRRCGLTLRQSAAWPPSSRTPTERRPRS